MSKRIILAGGSGFVGSLLTAEFLKRGYEITVLSRTREPRRGSVTYLQWDGKTVGYWGEQLNGAEAVINLAGKTINCRHTPENRRAILESRVDSVHALRKAISGCHVPPKVFVQASAVGIYGDTGDRIAEENAPYGNDFVAKVCEEWEAAFADVVIPGGRKIVLRLGVVLGRNGGFLRVLDRLTRRFLGGHVGDGCQFVSWIHATDLAHMFVDSVERPDLEGTFNASSPNPARNRELMRELRRALYRPWSPPVPKIAARLGSWLLGTEAELALISQRVVPKRFLGAGFKFEFPELRSALADIYRHPLTR